MAAGRSGFTIVIHRDGALESRQVRLPLWLARTIVAMLVVAIVAVLAAAIAWGPIVSAAARAPLLEHQVAQLRHENERVNQLARLLDEAEAKYAHLRSMLGVEVMPPPVAAKDSATAADSGLYVTPPMYARAPNSDTSAAAAAAAGPTIPARWPLAVHAFRTRGLESGDSAEQHSGVDLAVPIGTDVRASGGGIVAQTGTDSSYGLFVLLQHPDQYQTMYGHLSRVLVTRGEKVREGQVIALTGSSGRSTAPHLHFEVRHRGRSVDPLTLMREGY